MHEYVVGRGQSTRPKKKMHGPVGRRLPMWARWLLIVALVVLFGFFWGCDVVFGAAREFAPPSDPFQALAAKLLCMAFAWAASHYHGELMKAWEDREV